MDWYQIYAKVYDPERWVRVWEVEANSAKSAVEKAVAEFGDLHKEYKACIE